MLLLVKGTQRRQGAKGRYRVIIVTNNGTLETPVGSCMGSHKIGKTMADFMRAADQSMHAAAKSPTTITETSPFSKEQLEHLYRLFDQSPSSNSLPSCSLAQTGKSVF